MNEKTILDKLFNLNQEKPKKTYRINGMSFTLVALSEQKIENIRNRYSAERKDRGEQTHGFNRALIVESTVAIGGDPNITWKHPELIEHYKASSPEQVVKRVLLPGHIAELADKVLELSGYYDRATEEEEVKNLSGEEN